MLSLEKTNLERTVKEENKLEIDFVTHTLVPALQVVLISGEAVNKEILLARVLSRQNNIQNYLETTLEFNRNYLPIFET